MRVMLGEAWLLLIVLPVLFKVDLESTCCDSFSRLLPWHV